MKFFAVVVALICLYSFPYACKEKKEIEFPGVKGEEIENAGNLDETYLPEHIKSNYELVWNDEFSGTTLNLSKWMFRFPGIQREIGWLAVENVSLNGMGQLVIKATYDASKNKYYTGMIATQGIYEQQYGYFESRISTHKSIGPHVAFWLQSPANGATLNPAVDGMEVDIMEYHRMTPDTWHINMHWDGYGKHKKSKGYAVNYSGIGNGFHVYGLEWTADGYIFYINGKEKWRYSEVVSHRPQYVILSMEITGMGGDPTKGSYPDQALYDYVRIYKKK